VAAEAVVNALIGCNGKRGGLFSMERAKSEHVGTGPTQGYILTHHILNGITGYEFIDK
jgi:hypothetical protein